MNNEFLVLSRYDKFSRVLHWTVACVIIYAMSMGYLLHILIGTRWFTFFSELNMSLGTIAIPIMSMRFIWRFFRPAVPYPSCVSRKKIKLICFIHEIFYLTIFVVLISGLLMLKMDYSLFGLLHISHPIRSIEVNEFFFKVHRVSCILLGAMLLGHIAVVAKYLRKGEKIIILRMF